MRDENRVDQLYYVKSSLHVIQLQNSVCALRLYKVLGKFLSAVLKYMPLLFGEAFILINSYLEMKGMEKKYLNKDVIKPSRIDRADRHQQLRYDSGSMEALH